MNKKIIVLVGISGSGKSTLAHQEWLKDPLNTVVVNRDKIRELLFGYTEETVSEYYRLPNLGALEKQVTLFEDTLIHDGLNLGKTVIADATHLEMKYLEKYRMWNVPVEYKYFNVGITEAIKRDAARTRKVGAEVIQRQYDKFQNLERLDKFEPVAFPQNKSLPACIIYDIDGTIAEKGDRNPFDWKAVGKDTTINSVINTIDWLDAESKPFVIICTGRDAICSEETKEWLKDNAIQYDTILFRPEGDQRPDWVIKEEMWRMIAQKFYIVGMYDDRNAVTRRARSLGLKVFQVEYGNF